MTCSIAVHSNGFIVASGQGISGEHAKVGFYLMLFPIFIYYVSFTLFQKLTEYNAYLLQAHIRIWRIENLETLKVLGEGFFTHPVTALAFSGGNVRFCLYN